MYCTLPSLFICRSIADTDGPTFNSDNGCPAGLTDDTNYLISEVHSAVSLLLLCTSKSSVTGFKLLTRGILLQSGEAQ